ncbi:alpha-1,2-fucosyltransferase [Pedobacter sp. AW31-3R]|uniref:alpha-1,2-fucosyltransferase n=1 Tax=Pedobacter sp. AW31-3R TaxID=3445781 RepID=UPI003FA064A0
MIIVKLQGGIGNQFFQFAFGRALAVFRGEELYFDLSFLQAANPNITFRVFKLGKLHHYKILDMQNSDRLKQLFDEKSALLISDDFPKKDIMRVAADKNIVALYLDGYFQNEFYFSPYADEIRTELRDLLECTYQLSGLQAQNIVVHQESIAIHLRRTDYLNPSALCFHGICEVDYYQKALQIIEDRTTQAHLYLFSDDNILADEMFCLVRNKTNISSMLAHIPMLDKDLVELALMAKCRHFVIANSSYSWWGSYLSDSPDKLIVAPKQWYTHIGFTRQSEDIALPSWIRI